MTVYYRDDAVQITSSWIRVHDRAYPVESLSYVWHRRGRRSARANSRLLGRWVLVTLLSAPIGFGALCAVSVFFADWGTGGRLGLGVLGVVVAVVGALALAPLLELPLMALERSYDRGTAVHEMWAQCAGEEVLLMRTTDAQRFGRIYRAVERAVEQSTDRAE